MNYRKLQELRGDNDGIFLKPLLAIMVVSTCTWLGALFMNDPQAQAFINMLFG